MFRGIIKEVVRKLFRFEGVGLRSCNYLSRRKRGRICRVRRLGGNRGRVVDVCGR